ncbi:hypothetical protein [uncultured Bacteroides sp.]|jgi:hypothetical protein|uniref:hypothetical protein n=1 Tax=uncultured Bacteroides sp. TaxID=162156 RepID=UPI002585FAA4|nr:hypothetical protein [uncultured Bacteroides sp.]
MDEIKNILVVRGYTERQAFVVASELFQMDDSLQQGLRCWLVSEEETDYTVEGFKLSELKYKFEMTYPAALLTIDWLIKEPERAVKSINRGIK